MSNHGLKTQLAAKQASPYCKTPAGAFRPMIDARRCEGKGECVVVCPYDVFEVRRMTDDTFHAMPVRVKLKVWAHGRRTAATPRADACRACGFCVAACPERAITLVRHATDASTGIEHGGLGNAGGA